MDLLDPYSINSRGGEGGCATQSLEGKQFLCVGVSLLAMPECL